MKIWKRISVVVIVLCLMLLPMQVCAEQNSVPDQLRQEIRTALLNHDSELNVEKYEISLDEVTALYRQIVTEEADFWYVAEYCGYIGSGNIAISLQFYYFFDAQQVQQIQGAVQDALAECIHSGMSDAHKALALHDYLVLHCAYDTNYLNYDAYSALVWGSAVCQGYAEAYEILLDAVGIESKVISSEAMNHAWNLVQIDGQWYHVDVTWDDPLNYYSYQDTPGMVSHAHFLCSDSQIQALDHHSWESDIACTSTAYDGEMFWDKTTSAIWFLSDKEVLMRRDGVMSMEIYTKNLQTGTETMLYADMNKYYEHNGLRYYAGCQGLSFDNGTVYFADMAKIYKLSDLSGTPEVVCTLEELGQGHYIYSSYVDGIILRAVVVNRDTHTTQVVTKLLEEAHVHTWSDGVVTVEPTDKNQGEICYTCTGCGEVYRKILEKVDHVHSYRRTTFMPTCTTGGYTIFTCNCGYSYEGDQVAPLGHKETVRPGISPTCTQEGLTEGKYCARCYEWLVAQETIPALGHNWESGICAVCRQACDHGNVAALDDGDCTTAVICPTCHMTAREANATHVPGMDDGDCTTAVKCRYCSKIATPARKNHTPGANANCVRPQTCIVCGHITGKPTPHIYSDNVDGTCNVCNIHRETVEARKVVHMFRMYNPNTGEHFYTGSTVERDNLVAVGWQYEGIGFTFPANTGLPVHRLFQPSTGEHLYTMDEAEKNKLMAEGWNYEGIAFNSAYNTEAVQHRLHNPNAKVGAYHFTFSEEEKQNLIAAGWEYQGIGWYSCWK